MSEATEGRAMLVGVYRSKPFHNPYAPKGGYWFLRVTNPINGLVEETPLTAGKAEQFKFMGVPQLPDGGGL